jgi:tripartite motif-containing protein 71
VPSMESLVGGQQAGANEVAYTNPEAVAARLTSATAYEGQSEEVAENLAGETFPNLIGDPDGGPPRLPVGQQITSFVNPYVADISFGGGERGLVESTVPMALEASAGSWSPVNLGLQRVGDGFEPANPLVNVRAPARLSEGIQLPGIGLNVTPVDPQHSPLGGSEGVVDGATLFFANTQTDTDTVFKPSTSGFAIETLLRSVKSPTQVSFEVALPMGASLSVAKDGSGSVSVLKEDIAIAVVPKPLARDAAGRPVPVAMTIDGDVLTLTITPHPGEQLYPIVIDPEFNTTIELQTKGNWHHSEASGGKFEFETGSWLRILHQGSFPISNWAYFASQTKGDSKIYAAALKATLEPADYNGIETSTYPYYRAWLEIFKEGVEYKQQLLSGEFYIKNAFLCVEANCPTAAGAPENIVRFEVTSVESSSQAIEKGIISEPTYYGGHFTNAETFISQPKETHSTVEYNHTSRELEYQSGGKYVKTANVFYGNGWMGPSSGAFEFESKDVGLGVSGTSIEVYEAAKWETVVSKNYLVEEAACLGVQCNATQHEVGTYAALSGHLVNGENKIRVSARDPMANTWSSEHGEGERTLYVDTEAPHEIKISGLSVKGETYELGENEAHLRATAVDGEGIVLSSGIKSLGLEVDGKGVGSLGGECSLGPCTGSMEWSINGAELGTGQHTLTVVATDQAGNITTKNFSVLVFHASPVAMGPGSVNPESGDFALEATDVNVSGGMGTLTVARHYDSRNVTEGGEGPLGPQWSINLGGLASLEVLPDASVMVVGPEGLTHFSRKSGGEFEAPTGDTTLTLEFKSNEYILENKAKGTTTRFTLPSGANSWMPTASTGLIATDTTTDEYETVEPEAGKKIVQPTFELAPHPPASCVKGKLAAGCRALEFVYGTETKAKGENQAQWGDYKSHLKEILFAWYNVAKGTTETVAVAQYEYDGQGRLRAEWDPRISPALKRVYGYDPENHVTAITQPGMETWTATYGTITGDPITGRLLKGTQAPASAKLWDGELPTLVAAPKLSGSTSVNVVIGASSGTWTNEPVSYSYQWKDCNSEGKECTPILGATNANYTPGGNDVGHALIAQVTATNGGGSVVTSTSASSIVSSGLTEYETGPEKAPKGITAGPDGKLWFTDDFDGDINKITTSGSITQYWQTAKDDSQGIVTGPDGNLWFTNAGNWSIGKITTTGTITEYTLPLNSNPEGITVGSDKNLWFTDENTGKIGKITTSGTVTEYAVPAGGGSRPYSIAAGTDGNLWFTELGPKKIGKITTAGTITEYAVPSGASPYNITAGPDMNLWFTDSTAKIGKITTAGTITEYPLPAANSPIGITTGPDNNLWFTFKNNETSTGKIGRISTTGGSFTEWTLPLYSRPRAIATGPDGNVWYTVEGTDKIGTINLKVTQGEHYATGPGATVEYQVPLSGAGLPNLTAGEVEKWGQKDDPVEGSATAIFPPDESQSWPAADYRRATILYFDAQARTVNTASPSGAVSTTEYDENNDVKRTLSAANRETALGAGCESKEKCKSAESAKLLDTESKYAREGTELVETVGPQHAVKLSAGSEVQARNLVKHYYDEGSPEGKEYGLVTRTIDSALVNGKEEEPRTTRTYYSGQQGLGWKLRKPTSVVTDPAGLDLVQTSVYNETTGSVVETKSPGGSVESVYPPTFSNALGTTEGSGSNQFNHPEGSATDSSGNLWVDDKNNHRLQKFSPAGELIGSYGSAGKGEGQFENAWGIAINQSTNEVFVGDYANDRISVFSNTGTFLRMFGSVGSGNGQLNGPVGLTLDSSGNVWVADDGNNRIEEFSSTGTYISKFGKLGSGNGELKEPLFVAICEGELFVVDHGNNRIQEFSRTGEYLNQFGSEGTGNGQFKKPEGIAVDPMKGNLYVSDEGNERIEEFSPAGKFLTTFGAFGEGVGGLHGPTGLAVGPTGKIYIADQYNARIDEWLPPETGGARMTYSTQFGGEGSGNGHFSLPVASAVDGSGMVWVTDYYNGRVQKFSATGEFLATYGMKGTGNGQFTHPTGIGINQSTGNVYIGDCGNSRIEELNSSGAFVRTFGSAGTEPGQFSCMEGVKIDAAGNVWVADKHNNRIQEFSSTGTFIAAYGSLGSGNGQFNGPEDIAFSGGNMYVTDFHNNRVQELSMTGTYIKQFGSEGANSGQFKGPEAMVTDAAGNLYVDDNGNARIEEFKASGGFLATFGSAGTSEGQMSNPLGLAINAGGVLYVVDSANNRVDIWMPADQAVHDTKTIYYTAKGEAEVATCQNHPEWVNLICEITPAMQPETSELPHLPVATIKYNVWDEAEIVTEVFGSTTRTKTTSFDPAGRPLKSEIASTVDTPVSATTVKYDGKSGALVEESTTVAGKTKSISRGLDTLGQLESYTDADGSTTTYKHDIDGRITETTNLIETVGNKTSTYQKYTYDTTTGFMAKLEDSAAGTFTANHDAVGRITSETYPNAMTETHTYNTVGAATRISYEKIAHCASTCPETWFKESVVPSTHGETVERVNTLTTDAYLQDATGRLLQVQETPVGKGCVTRLYAYDEESNRTSLTNRPTATEGKCATEGGTTETHRYDPANRLIDNGVSYETFGNITKLPGADAGGPEMEIKTEYYVDNQVASQTQNGVTYKYSMDPASRVRETKKETGGKIVAEIMSHYAGPGAEPSWTSEEEGKKWTRDIPGMDGTLTAIQPSTGTITLQLHDLQGDIVDTAADNENETKISTSYNSTEFGAPLNGPPPTKYSWLGAIGITSEQTSGLVTQDGVTYVPQTGRPLQTQGIVPPTPDNKAIAYVSTIEAGIDTSAAAASAQQVVNAEQAKKALEESALPAGEEPSPEGEGEGGGEGPPPLEGSESLEGSCSGGGACAAAYKSCAMKSLFGEGEPGVLWLVDAVNCNQTVSGIQIKTQIWVWDPGAKKFTELMNDGADGQIARNTSRAAALIKHICAQGLTYRAWVWGYAWGSKFWFTGHGQTSANWKCEGYFGEFGQEMAELLGG